jgi:transcriptional regulator with XRE-family HTH domain
VLELLGDVLRFVRVQKKIKLSAVAKFLQITNQAYGAYERNVRMPDIATIGRISDFLGVSVDYLLETNYSKLCSAFEINNVPADNFIYRQSVANRLMILQDSDFEMVKRMINIIIKAEGNSEMKRLLEKGTSLHSGDEK